MKRTPHIVLYHGYLLDVVLLSSQEAKTLRNTRGVLDVIKTPNNNLRLDCAPLVEDD